MSVRATREELQQAALRLGSAGWPVFRIKPGEKVPLDRSNGFKDATTALPVIRAWWDSLPYNIAIPTGTLTADVLDVDVKPDGSGWPFNRLKRAGLLSSATVLVKTRSGGLHVYFAGTDQPCGRLPRHHLDFKATGGYVLVPPSFVEADDRGPAGSYELLDHRQGAGTRLDWGKVRQLLDPPPARQRTEAGAAGDSDEIAEARRAGILRYAAESNTKGGWADALFNAGCLYAKNGASLADALADIVPAALPWNDHEAARAKMHVRNGWQRGSSRAEAMNQ